MEGGKVNEEGQCIQKQSAKETGHVCQDPQEQSPVSGGNPYLRVNEHTLQAGVLKLGECPQNPCGRVAPAPQSLIEGPCNHFSNAPEFFPAHSAALHCYASSSAHLLSEAFMIHLLSFHLLFEPCPQGTAFQNGQGFPCSSS